MVADTDGDLMWSLWWQLWYWNNTDMIIEDIRGRMAEIGQWQTSGFPSGFVNVSCLWSLAIERKEPYNNWLQPVGENLWTSLLELEIKHSAYCRHVVWKIYGVFLIKNIQYLVSFWLAYESKVERALQNQLKCMNNVEYSLGWSLFFISSSRFARSM